MKNLILEFALLALTLSCTSGEYRDRLQFGYNIKHIEVHMQKIDSILPKLPTPKNEYTQSYFYEVIEQDTILFINAIPIGPASSEKTKKYLDSIFIDKRISHTFLNSSRMLAKNNLTHCVKDYFGWVYVYKYSNDRYAYRPVILNNPNKQKFMIDSCGFSLIDKKGNILLFKERNTNN